MTNKQTFLAVVRDGKIPDYIRRQIADFIGALDGRMVRVTVEEAKKTRSLAQNDFYWGFVIPPIRQMFEDAGTSCSPDDVHCFLKEHVMGMTKVIILPDGTRRAIVETSTKLTTAEWETNIDKVRAWAAQWGVQVPFPNDGWIDEVLQGAEMRDTRV